MNVVNVIFVINYLSGSYFTSAEHLHSTTRDLFYDQLKKTILAADKFDLKIKTIVLHKWLSFFNAHNYVFCFC